MTDSTLADLLFLIRAEFLEIPGLQLTQRQIEHLWGIDARMASFVLSSLVEAQFLTRTHLGTYTRNACSGSSPTQMGYFVANQGRAIKH